MLTLQKIKLYKYCGGDNDHWVKSGKKDDTINMQDSDWYLIFGFVSDLTIVKNGLAAETYIADVNKRLSESCDSVETIEEIKKLIK